MSNSFLKGALIITIGTILSKIIGSIYRIPLQNIAGDEVLGIFTLVYPVYMSVLIVTVAGIPLAISQLIARANKENRKQDVQEIFFTAGILAKFFGIVSFALMFFFADKIAPFLGGNYAVYSIMVVSVTLLIAPYMAVYRGLFQGFGTMKPTAISQVLEQFVRVVLIIVAAYILTAGKWSSDIVGAGVMIGSSVGAFASLLYLRWMYIKAGFKEKNKTIVTYATFKRWSKRILIVSIPICIGALTVALLNMVDSVTIPPMLKTAGYRENEIMYSYGLYGRGLAIVQLAVVFTSALVLPLIPRITAEFTKGNDGRMNEFIGKIYKLTHLTSWPTVVGLVVLTLPLNLSLFTNFEGSTPIAILSFSSLFTSFAVLTTGILQGMNKAKQAAVIVLVCTVVKVGLNLVLVTPYGLTGAALATLITYVLLMGLNLLVIYRDIPLFFFQRESITYALSSVVMGIVIGAPLLFIAIDKWTRMQAFLYTGFMFVIGSSVYLILLYVLKGVTKEEFNKVLNMSNLRR